MGGVGGGVLELAGGIELHGTDGSDLVAGAGGEKHHQRQGAVELDGFEVDGHVVGAEEAEVEHRPERGFDGGKQLGVFEGSAGGDAANGLQAHQHVGLAGGKHREDVQEIGAAEGIEDGGTVGVHRIELGAGPCGHAGGVGGAVFRPAFVLVLGKCLPGRLSGKGGEAAALAGLLAAEEQGHVVGVSGIGSS